MNGKGLTFTGKLLESLEIRESPRMARQLQDDAGSSEDIADVGVLIRIVRNRVKDCAARGAVGVERHPKDTLDSKETGIARPIHRPHQANLNVGRQCCGARRRRRMGGQALGMLNRSGYDIDKLRTSVEA